MVRILENEQRIGDEHYNSYFEIDIIVGTGDDHSHLLGLIERSWSTADGVPHQMRAEKKALRK